MKYIKLVFLGAFVSAIFLPSLSGNNIKIQRVSGEVKSNQIVPVVVENKEQSNSIATALPQEKISDEILDRAIAKKEVAEINITGEQNKQTVSIPTPKSQYDYQLFIPKIGVDSPVLGLGLEASGKMDVPDNYFEVGWYSGGASIGEIGNAVLGAHVDNGLSISGVFKNLKNLNVGDEIYTSDKLGEKLHFKVTKIKTYDYRTNDTNEVFGNVGKRQLALITCHGTFLPTEGTYSERLVVFAELIA